MAPLTKDSVEVAGSASEVASSRPAAPQTKPTTTPAAGGQLRADARSVEIPVKVHGSRVSDAPAGSAPRTEPFEEQTSTMIVFPQGSVIRMSTAVSVGQMLVVTNLKTRQDAICRVVKVRTFTNMQGYVEVEFTHKQEGYWGIQFSSSSPVAPVVAVPPAVSSSPLISAPVVSAPAPKPPVVVPAPPPVVTPVQEVQQVLSTPVVSGAIAPPPVVPPAAPVISAPVAQQVTPAPLPPPTFVPPPPPPPAIVPPVAQSTYVPPPPVTPAAKQETPFVWIGTQEEVQPAADSTLTHRAGGSGVSSKPVAPVRPAPVAEAPSLELPKIELPRIENLQSPLHVEEDPAPQLNGVLPFPDAGVPAPAAQLTLSELRGDEVASSPLASAASAVTATSIQEQAPAIEEKPAESSRAVFGSLSGGASFGAARSSSATRLESELNSSEEAQAAPRSSNFMMIAVCVCLLLAVVIGGGLYFRSQTKGSSSTLSQPTAQSQQVAAEQTALQNSATQSVVSGPVATVVPSGAPAVTVSANSSNNSKSLTAAKAPVNKIAAIMGGSAADAHPLTAHRTDSAEEVAAPALDAGSAVDNSNGNALPGIISSSSMAAPAAPEIRPEGPVVTGGKVAEPRLISRALPVYPQNAKQAGIGGDVVIKTTIDQKGNVVDMHIVSGPLMLRQAALDALKRWKYEPSKLDGQAIAVQMLVTIKFSR
jgi:TonB family protein